jgi:hypothetical protein
MDVLERVINTTTTTTTTTSESTRVKYLNLHSFGP